MATDEDKDVTEIRRIFEEILRIHHDPLLTAAIERVDSESDRDFGPVLRELVDRLVPLAATGVAHADDVDSEDTADTYIRNRLGQTTTSCSAGDLIGMVRENDPDFDDCLFADHEQELILVVGRNDLRSSGEELLERYLDYRDNYPEYEVVHPSDYTGPRRKSEEEEWARILDGFHDLVREWRDGFLHEMMDDMRRACTKDGSDAS